jgi:hypothetical protein
VVEPHVFLVKIWGFPYMGVPKYGWFIVVYPNQKWMRAGEYPHRNPPYVGENLGVVD